jgi:RND family efflux transporter MFP subunit
LVEEYLARNGDLVRKGEVLVKQRTLTVQLLLDEARARLSEIEARADKAKADVRRFETLFGETFVSEEELEVKRTELETLNQQRRQQQAAIRVHEDRLARLVVRAPFSGQVVAERTEVGQWLGEGDPVAVLVDLAEIHIQVAVPERQVAQVVVGGDVKVTIDALGEAVFTGRVQAVVPRADKASRSFPVEVAVTNPQRRILAGMLARVTFFLGQPRLTLLVPKDALVPQPQGDGHVVRVSDGQTSIVPVKLLGSFGDRFAVEAIGGSLEAGDRVIVRGNERVRPGQSVREAENAS